MDDEGYESTIPSETTVVLEIGPEMNGSRHNLGILRTLVNLVE